MVKGHKIIESVFVLLIFLFLAVGLFVSTMNRRQTNSLENRTAYKMSLPKSESWFAGEYQKEIDLAINDQVVFADRMKMFYYTAKNNIVKTYMKSVGKKTYYEGVYTYDGEYLVYTKDDSEGTEARLLRRIENYNRILNKNKNVTAYIYYIEDGRDIDFDTSEKSGRYELIKKKMLLPSENIGKLSTDNYEQYKLNFYKTDHHWCNKGAYKGYCTIARMLFGDEVKPIKNGEEILISDNYIGSKSMTRGGEKVFFEKFYAYVFKFPQYSIVADGNRIDDYGNQSNLSFSHDFPGYGYFYGNDIGEIVFDTGESQKENLLVIGDSYDNPILKLLASHFNKLYSVDLRYYKSEDGKPFSFGEYTKKHRINKVLFIGGVSYFTSDSFEVTD